MSDLFMDMHHRHLSRAAASFGSGSATANGYQPAALEIVDEDVAAGDNEEFENVLSLKLKKPKHWKWELSTSRSCSNISLPRILLYDHEGQLLVDANSQEEQVYNQPDYRTRSTGTRKRPSQRASTTNLTNSIRKALDREFNGLQIQEATPSSESSRGTPTARSSSAAAAPIDFYTNDLPDYKFERRSSSLKGVRFKEQDSKNDLRNSPIQIVDLLTPPSTTTTTTTHTSTSSGPSVKRRYRRSRSSGRSPVNSPSILERFSFNRGRFSSPEYAEEHMVQHAPRYFLRTSKAGTLVVKEDSFSRYRRRRKPKNSSSENLDSKNSLRNRSNGSFKMMDSTQKHLELPSSFEPRASSLKNISETHEGPKQKSYPVRRHRSDGNMLIQRQYSTSEEEAEQRKSHKRPHRKYAHFRRHHKADLLTVDSGNEVFRRMECATGR